MTGHFVEAGWKKNPQTHFQRRRNAKPARSEKSEKCPSEDPISQVPTNALTIVIYIKTH